MLFPDRAIEIGVFLPCTRNVTEVSLDALALRQAGTANQRRYSHLVQALTLVRIHSGNHILPFGLLLC